MKSITEQAAEWLDSLDDAAPHERSVFIAWLKESPRHVGEFLAVAAVSRQFDAVDPERRIDVEALLADASPNIVPLKDAEELEKPASISTHRPARWIPAIAATIAIIAVGSIFYIRQHAAPQSYETSTGEQRSIELNDGSLVHVNARSRIEIRYSVNTRTIRLVSGEALFKVAHDPARPFNVEVAGVRLRALGTQFNVYRRANSTTVSVLEGRVQISNSPATPALGAGQEVDIATNGKVSPPASLNEVRVTAWRQRKLVFRNDRLADVASEFNRYNRAPQIRVSGSVATERRLTGIFDADDPESLVLFLAGSDLSVRRDASEVVIQDPK